MTIKKNMLFIASIVTLSFAGLLVWMDNALAQYIKTRPIPVPETVVPEIKHSGSNPEQTCTLPLPEVCISAPKSKAAGTNSIP
ncbi:MAG: hypothetical protein R3D58_21065 [Saprospiraceae bacterium]|nr:hypothetical protein [Lewinellaceae bacterium]